jgi:hypothetical protein
VLVEAGAGQVLGRARAEAARWEQLCPCRGPLMVQVPQALLALLLVVSQLVSLAAVAGTPQSAVHAHLQVWEDIQWHASTRQILNIGETRGHPCRQEDIPVPDPLDSYMSQMQAKWPLLQ